MFSDQLLLTSHHRIDERPRCNIFVVSKIDFLFDGRIHTVFDAQRSTESESMVNRKHLLFEDAFEGHIYLLNHTNNGRL